MAKEPRPKGYPSVISMNHALFSQMETEDWEKIKTQLQEDLKNYYSEMGGI